MSQRNKRYLVILFFFLILIPSTLYFFLGVHKKTIPITPSQDKTWEVIISYKPATDSYTSQITLLHKHIEMDDTMADKSDLFVQILNGEGKVLYTKKVIINQFILDVPVLPEKVDTTLYLPYIPSAEKLRLQDTKKTFLMVPVPTAKDDTEKSSVLGDKSCNPLHIVFISDNYTDFDQFHNDAKQIEDAFVSTEPFSSKSGIFSFDVIDNDESLGCAADIQKCISNKRITDIGTSKFPQSSKFVVLAKSYIRNQYGVVGISDFGGIKSVVGVESSGLTKTNIETAVHEVLGHEISLLNDRYIYPSGLNNALKLQVKSNCSDNPDGEAYWKDAGADGVYKGCIRSDYYAPFNPSCGGNTGSPGTVMSAAGCSKNNSFDSVERAWITNEVMSKYSACPDASPTAKPSPTPSQNACPANVKPGEAVSECSTTCPNGKKGSCSGHTYCEWHEDGNTKTDCKCENTEKCVDDSSASCKDNPTAPPDGYTWKNSCKACSSSADCPQNTSDGLVKAETSNWCYGGKCLLLVSSGSSSKNTSSNDNKKSSSKKSNSANKKNSSEDDSHTLPGNGRGSKSGNQAKNLSNQPKNSKDKSDRDWAQKPIDKQNKKLFAEGKPTMTPLPPDNGAYEAYKSNKNNQNSNQATPAVSPTPQPPLAEPTNWQGFCGPTTNKDKPLGIKVSWDAVSGATRYAVRIDEDAPSWEGDTPSPGDTVENNVKETAYVREAKAGATYQWWIHSVNGSGVYSALSKKLIIKCPTSANGTVASSSAGTVGAGQLIVLP